MSLPLAHDYRFDPFGNVSTAVNITNEEHVIPSSSPFTISLYEIPKHDSPSTLSIKVKDLLAAAIITSGATSITVTHGAWFAVGNTITIDSEQMYVSGVASNALTVTRGYNSTTATTHSLGAAVYIESSMTEVEATPASGQFWPDYSTGADGQSDWNTGTLLFNAADAGKTIVVSYVGTGTLVAVEKMRALHRCVVFTLSDIWTAPEGVDRINVLLIGGGGGGGGGGTPAATGGNGGNSTFGGTLLVAGGGKGAIVGTTAAQTGSVSTSSAEVLIETHYFHAGVVGAAGAVAGAGGDATGYGNGGGSGGYAGAAGKAGAFPNNNSIAGSSGILGGAAGGGAVYAVAVPVTAGNSYTVTIGAGGIGGDSTYDGGDGSPGICIIWY